MINAACTDRSALLPSRLEKPVRLLLLSVPEFHRFMRMHMALTASAVLPVDTLADSTAGRDSHPAPKTHIKF